jgi:hypothetical protein
VQIVSPCWLIARFSLALGPRIIPFFRDIVQLAVGILRDSLHAKQGE